MPITIGIIEVKAPAAAELVPHLESVAWGERVREVPLLRIIKKIKYPGHGSARPFPLGPLQRVQQQVYSKNDPDASGPDLAADIKIAFEGLCLPGYQALKHADGSPGKLTCSSFG